MWFSDWISRQFSITGGTKHRKAFHSSDLIWFQISIYKSGMETIKKQEWPSCADLSIKYIHMQCQNFSKSGVPSPSQLTSLIELIDDFIFSWSSPASNGQGRHSGGKSGRRRTGKLSSIQQLQLIQMLADYFTGDHDFNLSAEEAFSPKYYCLTIL